MTKKKVPVTVEECATEIELTQKKIRQLENRNKMLDQKLAAEKRKARNHRLIVRGAIFESIIPEAKDMTDEEAAELLRTALTSEEARAFLRKRTEAENTEEIPWLQGYKGVLIHPNGCRALCRGLIVAQETSLRSDIGGYAAQGKLHFPCDSLRCLPFCTPLKSRRLALQAVHFQGVNYCHPKEVKLWQSIIAALRSSVVAKVNLPSPQSHTEAAKD